MLELKNVKKTFFPGTVNEKVALKGIDLTLEDGDFVTIIGGNGAGKSTLLNAISGAWNLDCGEVIIDGINVTHLPEHKRAKFFGRVFQDPMMGTAADMEIEENLLDFKIANTENEDGTVSVQINNIKQLENK